MFYKPHNVQFHMLDILHDIDTNVQCKVRVVQLNGCNTIVTPPLLPPPPSSSDIWAASSVSSTECRQCMQIAILTAMLHATPSSWGESERLTWHVTDSGDVSSVPSNRVSSVCKSYSHLQQRVRWGEMVTCYALWCSQCLRLPQIRVECYGLCHTVFGYSRRCRSCATCIFSFEVRGSWSPNSTYLDFLVDKKIQKT